MTITTPAPATARPVRKSPLRTARLAAVSLVSAACPSVPQTGRGCPGRICGR